jgi:HPt (histidine-containing phosphotransfer) domain-containing protein
MNTASILDPAALARLSRLGGGKFTCEMIDLFLDYAGKKIAEACLAQAAGDLVGLAKAAHPLKSSAGNVGASHVQALASALEQHANQGRSEEAAAELAELEQAFAVASRELKTVKEGLADQSPPAPSS